MKRKGVRVVAFEADDGDVIKPCCGYRFEYGDRAVVLSGDTRYNANVISYGAGADLLAHEVANARPGLMADATVRRIIGHHAIPSKADCVFAPRGDSGLLRLFAGNETEFAREHVEESLGHLIGNAVERAYRRQAALEKRRVMMEAWSAFCG